MSSYCAPVRVRFADTDQAGVVYHANYIPWLETGRTEALRAHGLPYTELDARGIHFPVLDLRIRYHRPALYDMVVEVWTHIQELTRTRVQFGYTLRAEGQSHPRPLAVAGSVHSFVDRTGRVLRMDRYPDLWDRISAAAERLGEDAG